MIGVDDIRLSRCLYLYGIVEVTSGTVELLLPGDRLVVVGTVGALCRDLDAAALNELADDSGDGLLRLAEQHDTVLRRHAADGAAVLPVRLGTLYADMERVRATLHASSEQLQQKLRQLRGRAEWTVRIRFGPIEAATGAEIETVSSVSGRDYLAHRRAARRGLETERTRREHLAAQLDGVLRELADDARARHQHGDAALATAYLVPHDRAEAFARRVTEAAAVLGADRAEVVLDGPLPAWSFADVHLEVSP